jgi:integrating conjugative element protein (TIGR03746 family)
MSSQKFTNALASSHAHNKQLLLVILAIVFLASFGIYFAWRQPKAVDIHIATDLRSGDTIRVVDGVAPINKSNVYSFGYYIWQQINRWQADGEKDYGQQIYAMQYFLTPSWQAQLKADLSKRHLRGELRRRTRHITEIPGFPYSENRVVSEGRDAWTVLLDMQVMETFGGSAVKDVFIRYPLRVVRFDVDRERNPWLLALDCFGSNAPARLNPADLNPAAAAANLKAPRLPGTVAPSSLPSDTSVD